jgi:predicted PurR-regulated permease PerM
MIFYLLYLIKDILVLFFVVLILAATFRPVVNKWETKIKRIPAVLLLLLIILMILAFIGYIVFPPLISQITTFVQSLPQIIDRLSFLSSYKTVIESSLKSLTNNVSGITGGFVSVTASVFGGIFAFLTAIAMTIYLLLDKNGFSNFVRSIVPQDSQIAVTELARKISLKVGDWFRGQMLLSLSVAVIDLIGLAIIGVPYALTLALIAGLLDLVPVIGPIIAGVIAALVALSLSPLQAVFVIILFVIVQQIENSILVPNIMKKAVGLSPVVIILAVLIGAKLLGLIGALLAVPISAIISVIIQEWPTVSKAFKRDA